MRKTLLSLLLVVVVGTSNLAKSGSTQPKPGAVARDDVTTEITRLERQMWDLWKAQRFEDMRAHMTADATLVDSTGTTMNPDAAVAEMKKEPCQVESYSLTDLKVSAPAPGVALIVYRSTAEGVCGGKPIPPEGAVMSALWVKQGDRWLTALHQATRLQK